MCWRADAGLAPCPRHWPGRELEWCPSCRREALEALDTAPARPAAEAEEVDFACWLATWGLPWASYPGPGKWSEICPFPGCLASPRPLPEPAELIAIRLGWTFERLLLGSPN